jgi:hypothetical protein
MNQISLATKLTRKRVLLEEISLVVTWRWWV